MTPAKIAAALQTAFLECEVAFCSLNEMQKQILLSVVTEVLMREIGGEMSITDPNIDADNPLNDLSSEQRQALLQFIREQESQDRPWKIKLLNDWLHDRDSGTVQFIRELYGPQWLNRIKPTHIAQLFEQAKSASALKLNIGDRIEVSNALWEWVQEDGPCSREWFPCEVIALSQHFDNDATYSNAIVRFDNGMEFEIQGLYQWNRYNWRWSD
jgi:hypothetical protein